MKAKERIKELEAKIEALTARVAVLESKPNYVPNSQQPWYVPSIFAPAGDPVPKPSGPIWRWIPPTYTTTTAYANGNVGADSAVQ